MLTRIARRGEFDRLFERGGSIEKIDNKVRPGVYLMTCLTCRLAACCVAG